MRFLTTYLIPLFLFFLMAGNSWGQTTTWIGGTTGFENDWTIASNWNSGLPNSTNSAVIDGSSIYSCNLNTSFLINSITISGGSFNINSPGVMLTVAENINISGGSFNVMDVGGVNISCTNFIMTGGIFNTDPMATGSFTITNNTVSSTFNVSAGTFALNENFNMVFGSGASSVSNISYTNTIGAEFFSVFVLCGTQELVCNNDLRVKGYLTLQDGSLTQAGGSKLNMGATATTSSILAIEPGYLGGTLPIHLVESSNITINSNSPPPLTSFTNPIVVDKNTSSPNQGIVSLNINFELDNLTLLNGYINTNSFFLKLNGTLNYSVGNNTFITGKFIRNIPTAGTYIYPMGFINPNDGITPLYYPCELTTTNAGAEIQVMTGSGIFPDFTILPLKRTSKRMSWNVKNINTINPATISEVKLYAIGIDSQNYQGISDFSNSNLTITNTTSGGDAVQAGTTAQTGINFLGRTGVAISLNSNQNTDFAFATTNLSTINLLGNNVPSGTNCTNPSDARGTQNAAPFYNIINNPTFSLTSDNGLSNVNACSGTPLQDKWLDLDFLAVGTYSIEYTSNKNIGMELYAGCGNLVVCANDYGADGTEKINFSATGSAQYFLRIINYDDVLGVSGAISVRKITTPAGELACGAVNVVVGNAPIVFDITVNFQNHENRTTPVCSFANMKNDGWVKFIATSTSTTIKYTNTTQDAAFIVYSGTCDNLLPIGACTNQVNGLGSEILDITTVVGTTYYVRIIDAISSGSLNMNGTIFIIDTLPAITLSNSTNNTTNSFQANWSYLVGGANHYLLDVSTNASFSTFLPGYNARNVGVTDNWSITGLTANTVYYYRVRAVVNGITSPNPTNGQSASTLLPSAVISVPTNAITSNGFGVNWGAVSGADSYDVEYSTDNVTFVLQQNVSNSPYTFTMLSANTLYYVRVQAKNFFIPSATSTSNVVSVTTASLPAPIITTSNIIADGFQLNWIAINGATDYEIDLSIDNFNTFVTANSETYNAFLVGNVTIKTFTGLQVGNYQVRVRAKNTNVTSVNSNVLAVVIPVPIITLNTATNVTANSFTANWQDIMGADFYELDISTNDLFLGFLTGYNGKNVGLVTTENVTNLAPNTMYYYRLRAKKNGVFSANQTTVNVQSVRTLLPTPTANIATSVAAISFSANWMNVAGADGYIIDVATDNTFLPSSLILGNPFIVNTNTVTNTTITGLASGNTYYYRVKDTTPSNNSFYSNVIVVTTTILPVTLISATNPTANGFTANWQAVAGADFYELDVSNNTNFSTFVSGYNANNVGNVTAFPVTVPNPNNTYYYRVRASKNGALSANPSGQSVLTLLNTPTANNAINITSTGFTASWGSVAGANSYQLSYDTDANFNTATTLSNTTATSQTVTGLNANTTYYYRVQAFKTNTPLNNSDYSNVVNVNTTPTIPVPDAPLNVNANNILQTSFTINWDIVIGVDGYKIDVATNAGFTTFVPNFQNRDINNGATTSINVVGLTANTPYYFRVRAYVGAISSTDGIPNPTFVTTLPAIPNAPVAISATALSSTTFTANWNVVPNATSYEIEIATNAGFTGATTFTATTNSYTFNTANAGTIYYYRVRAVNTGGASANSNVISLITTPIAPTTSGVTMDAFTANWTATTGATDYILQVSDNSGFTSFVYNQSVIGTSQTITGLTTGTLYFVRVRINANTPNTISSDFSASSQVTPALQIPDAPVATSASNILNTSFTANWQASAGASSYELEIATDLLFNPIIQTIPNILNTTQNIAGLTQNTAYYYRVRAVNTAGTSPDSNPITVITTNITGNIPETPTDVSPFALSSTSIEVSWIDESSNETGFELQRKEGTTGVYATIYIAPANVTANNVISYIDTGLLPNTPYFYQVKAKGIAGDSPYSTENSITTLPENIERPTFLQAYTASNTSIELNWTDNANNEDGYHVYRAEQSGSFVLVTTNALPADATSFVDTGLNNFTTYFYYVEAIKGNSKSAPSNVSGATTEPVPTRPSGVNASDISTTSLTLNWADNSNNEDRFLIEIASLSSNGFFVFLKEVPANTTSTPITGLLPNQVYIFRVFAENGAGESPPATSTNIQTNIDPNVIVPSIPTELVAEAISTIEIGIRWKYNKNAPAVMFRVVRSLSQNGVYTEVGRILANKLNFNDTKNIIAGTTYYYKVIATNAGGDSQPSLFASVLAECNVTTVINTDQVATGNIACDSKQVLLQLSTNVTKGRLQWFKNGLAISGAIFSSYIATETGEYYCRILAGDCDKKSDIKSVLIVPSFIVQVAFNNGSLTSNRLGAGTYQWYYDYQPIAGAVQDTYTPTQPGTYYLLVTQGTCSAVSNLYTFVPTALEMSFSQALQIYPNPAEEEISLKIEHPQIGDFEVWAVDMQGRKINLSKGYKDETIYTQKINVTNLSKGIHLLEVNMKGLKGQKKLVKL